MAKRALFRNDEAGTALGAIIRLQADLSKRLGATKW